jgi:penicillin-binding protein 2
VIVWTLLLGRLFFLQVLEGERFRLSAERQSVRTHRVPASRGMVRDTQGVILVDSRPAFDVLVVPHETEDLVQAIRRVASLSGEPESRLWQRLGEVRGRARFQLRLVVRDVSRDALARIQARLWALPGVVTQASPLRSYPFGESAAHVLGTIGEISPGQLEARRYLGYRLGDEVGQSGIEAHLESDLRGKPGGRNVLVDVRGRELELLGELAPQVGRNVVLTLDHRLQIIAEQELDKIGRGGAVVALDPRSGAVLVLASRPSFDPNLFARGIDEPRWRDLAGHSRAPLQNRALQGQYPPGSTYKVVTAIAGLEEHLIGPETRVYCSGSFRLGRRRYRCWKEHGHGEVDLHRAIVESCDVFFYRAGLQLGVDRLAYYARTLGLGEPTQIDVGSEASGLVPTQAWKERRFGEPWIEGETLSVAIGQGFNLWTPIQLASLYATIANGGTRYRPFVVERVEEPEGGTIRATQPQPLGEIPISQRTLDIVRRGLRGVVQDPNGTGARLRGLPGGIEAAAKTGTAQVVTSSGDAEEEETPEEHRDHAWFVAYAPTEAPRIVVGVLVEHGGMGSRAAGPIARSILEAYFSPREASVARR